MTHKSLLRRETKVRTVIRWLTGRSRTTDIAVQSPIHAILDIIRLNQVAHFVVRLESTLPWKEACVS